MTVFFYAFIRHLLRAWYTIRDSNLNFKWMMRRCDADFWQGLTLCTAALTLSSLLLKWRSERAAPILFCFPIKK